MTAPNAEPCLAAADNDPAPCVLEVGHAGRHRDAGGYGWHHGFKHGRADVYEITWMSGHIEQVAAHQVTYPHRGLAMAEMLGIGIAADAGAPRIHMHAEINDRWRLTLAALEEDIRAIRLVTNAERLPGATS
jgi:hypothetical protein